MTVDDARRTQDVDALVSDKAVLEEAAALAEQEDLPPSWLNQNASPWIPPRELSATVGRPKAGLVVHVAPKEHLLAMKLVAMRRQDVPDIVSLGVELELAAAGAATFADLLSRVYQGEDALQQILGVPHDDVAAEALRLGAAAVRVMANANRTHGELP